MKSEDTFKDRLLFTLLTAAAGAVVAFVARQAITAAWQRATGRTAPKPYLLLNPAGTRVGESTAAFLMKSLPGLNRLQP